MCIGCEYKYFFFASCPFGAECNRQQTSCAWWLASGKCLCVSGKMVLWSIYFNVILLVPLLYLKFWNYIDRPSRRVRPVVFVVCPVVVVRLQSVRPVVFRPVVFRRRRCPSVLSSSSILCPFIPSCPIVVVVRPLSVQTLKSLN